MQQYHTRLVILTISAILIISMKDLQAQAPKKPGIKIQATVKGVKQFSEFRIHPDRYLLTHRWDQTGPVLKITNIIYDMQTGEKKELPDVRGLLPPAPEKPAYDKNNPNAYRAELARLKMSGNYWSYTGSINGDVVHYDPDSDTAGLIVQYFRYRKSIEGNPKCANGAESRFIEQYQSYYCESEKKFVPEEKYISETKIQEYVVLDAKNGKLVSRTELQTEDPGEDHYIMPIGCDAKGKKFYYYYVTIKNSHSINLRGVSTSSGKIVLKKEIPLPDRKNIERTINASFFRSPDFKKIIFWEYDELQNPKTGKLVNPGPVLIVADLESGDNFTLPGMVTMYGNAMDLEGKYLIVNSHQTGELVKYDLAQRKPVLKMNVTKNIYKWVLDSTSGLLYGFTMNQIEVRSFADLKLIKTIRYESVFPGIKQLSRLLSAETILETQSGRRAAIGILKQDAGVTWAGSDQDDGFYVMEFGE